MPLQTRLAWVRRHGVPLLFLGAATAVVAVTAYKFYHHATPSVTDFASQSGPGELRVLFVGNSLTDFHDMPGMVAVLLAAGKPDRPVAVSMASAGGLRLKDHHRSGVVRRLLRDRGPWDVVILQEQGALAYADPALVEQYTRELAVEATSRGARPLLYLDWCNQQGDDAAGYVLIGRRLGLGMVPVHLARRAVEARYPQLALVESDGYHPSPLGAYVTACTFYAVLASRSPEGLPWELRLPGSGAALPTVGIPSPDVGRGIQLAVWEAVRGWDRANSNPTPDG